MARRLRNFRTGGFYHTVNRGVDKCAIFHCASDYQKFMQLLSKACEKYNVPIVAFALMPNHFHILIKAVEDSQVSKWAKWYQGIYSQFYNKNNDRVGRLWQDRFFAKEIQNDLHLAKTWMYVEQNPVKANLTSTQEKWRWSSAYMRKIGLQDDFLIEPSWWQTKLKNRLWSEKLLDQETLEKVRKSLKSDSLLNEEITWTD